MAVIMIVTQLFQVKGLCAVIKKSSPLFLASPCFAPYLAFHQIVHPHKHRQCLQSAQLHHNRKSHPVHRENDPWKFRGGAMLKMMTSIKEKYCRSDPWLTLENEV
jgi:hypothetical protein